ncbi:hypothetical protein [Nonomuraea dietziae]|uniref:hypothetical protein n=1 Tax=Nonomuraea dietziae TaxID=65515 RepID=UPI00344796EA
MWFRAKKVNAARGLSAVEAVRVLMSFGFTGIRSRSHLVRRELAAGNEAEALRWLAEIHMIADVCHNLPADLRHGSRSERGRRATESLRFHLRELAPDDHAAQWVRETLDHFGFDYRYLLPENVRKQHGTPEA